MNKEELENKAQLFVKNHTPLAKYTHVERLVMFAKELTTKEESPKVTDEEIVKKAFWTNHLTEEHKEQCWEIFKKENKLTTKQESVTDKEELRQEAKEYLSKRDWYNEKVYNLMADFAESKLTPQANESELIEFEISLNELAQERCGLVDIEEIKELLTQFRNHQNTNKE